ncbi:MAG: GNAT family N-acetyltransferase [Eubacterium sp.]|nr:GNAT family N-acetyltransferase [Eubacterium sp.]
MSFVVYEMTRSCTEIPPVGICCIPFDKQYLEQYKTGYNAAFRPMREALGIKPYDWYHDSNAILEKSAGIYLVVEEGALIGSIACYGNEIDDLFVAEEYRHKGYGKQLLKWAMEHIASCGNDEMILHVAEWNQSAVQMYMNEGFVIVRTDVITAGDT